MGLFHHKQQQNASQPDDAAASDGSQTHFFDEYFREELRNHGRWYFEKVINENGELFKKDLATTVSQVNTELKAHITAELDAAIAQVRTDLKEHVTKQLDTQLAEYAKTMKDAQGAAIDSLTGSAKTLEQEYKDLSDRLQKNVAEQEALLHTTFEDNKSQITAMKDAQGSALEWLNQSVQALQDQHKQLADTLQKSIADQKALLMGQFEQNMARTVEHYLVAALGDQYDIKAQLPAIIKQLDENKQAMRDDITL